MEEMLIQKGTLTDLGDIIRAAKGNHDSVPVSELRDEFDAIAHAAHNFRAAYELDFGIKQDDPVSYWNMTLTNSTVVNMTNEGYLRFTATADDPYVCIGSMTADKFFCDRPSDELRYIVIKYRTNTEAKGEFYTARTDGVHWQSSYGAHVAWDWIPDGKWHTMLVDARYVWGNVNNVYLHSFRFDFLERYVAGASIDVEYIKFFAEKHYAEAFIQAEKHVESVVDGPVVDSRYVYNKNGKYYTGTTNVDVTKYPLYSFPSFPSAPQTSCDKIIAVIDGAEVPLVESVANQWLATNDGINDISGKYEKLIFKGWVNPAATGQTISSFGALINGKNRWDLIQVNDIYDAELCAIIGSETARRFEIAIDLTDIGDGIHQFLLTVSLYNGTYPTACAMNTWGIIYYRRKANYVDDAGNVYRVASNKVYKNGTVIDAIQAAAAHDSTCLYPYIAYNPQIEVFEKVAGYNGEFVYQDDVSIGTAVPHVHDGTYPITPKLVAMHTTSNGTYLPPSDAHGFSKCVVDVPDVVTDPLIVTENGVYIPSGGIDGYSSVTVDVPMPTYTSTPLTVTENGTYIPPAGTDGYAPINVNIPEKTPILEQKHIIKNGFHAPSEGYDGIGIAWVEVEPITESIAVTENGTYTPADGVDGFSSVEVAVDTMQEELVQTVDRSITEIKAEDLDGVQSIGYGAFQNCYSLKKVELPNSVSNLHSLAFGGCSQLSEIALGGVIHIGDRAFDGCDSLANIGIIDNVTHIGSSAFSSCYSLTSVTFGDGLTRIGPYAFTACSSLTSVTIPGCATEIYQGAFWGCTGLTSASIGSGIINIAEGMFGACSALAIVNIPETIVSIGKDAFVSCNSLTDVYYAGSKEEWLEIAIDSGNDALYSATIHYGKPSEPIGCEGLEYVSNGDGTCYVAGRGTCSHSEVVIPETSPAGDTVVAIGDSALKDNVQIVQVTIPSSVTTIGSGAFGGCIALNNLILSDGLITIGNRAFDGTALSSVEIPASVATIGMSAFANCTSLSNISVHTDNTVYYSNNNCLIERDTKAIVAGCSTSVIPDDGTVEQIADYAFDGCSGLTNIVIPDSVKSIGRMAFWRCSELTSVTIGNSVTSVGYEAFSGCVNLATVTFRSGVTPIADGMFDGCESLDNVIIPDGVTSIGDEAFTACTGLTNISIPASIYYIGVIAFADCTSLTDVYYAASKDEWANITIEEDNDPLFNATIHFAIEKPTTIFYASDLLTTVNTGMSLDAVVTDNNYVTYTYITYTPESNDPYYYPFMNVTGDRYLSIKYRTTTAAGAFIQFYLASSGGGPQNDDTMMKAQIVPENADGEWHTMTFDLKPLIDAGHYNGTYISYFRFDVLDAQGGAMPAGASIDIKYIAFFETETGANQNDEVFFEPNSTEVYVSPISTAYPYYGHIDYVNFDGRSLDGYREKVDGNLVAKPAIVDGFAAVGHPDPALAGKKVIVLSGWALVNGGQDKYFWSVDGQNWIEATQGYYGLTGGAHAGAAAAYGVNSVFPANGVFTNLVIDLTEYAGQTKDVYVGVRSLGAYGTPPTQRICNFLTFTNCTIPS